MPKIIMTKVSDKLAKVNETVNVNFYDNAFMVEVTGLDSSDNWSSIKLMCTSLSEVATILEEVENLPKSA